MCQGQGAENWKRRWWYFLLFPIFGMSLLAQWMMHSPKYIKMLARFETLYKLLVFLRKVLFQAIAWWFWWTRVFMLQATFCVGTLLLPIYKKTFIFLDADYMPLQSQRKRLFKQRRDKKGYKILTLAGRLCVYSNVCNVYGKDLVLLRQPVMHVSESYMNQVIINWNMEREKVGIFPPSGWPLSSVLMIMAVTTMMIVVLSGYIRILKMKISQRQFNKKANAFTTVFQSLKKNGAKVQSQMFDTDSTTIIVDNSANCIIWNDIKGFDASTYIPLGNKIQSGITSATGQAVPVGFGTLEIGWYDDNQHYHAYKLPNAYHVPESPVNILGLSSFSKIVGDYHTGGTRINSSGKDSVFTWDNGKFSRTFSHSESHMPEMPVNNGYSKFYKLCNFLDKFQPKHQQCYHVKATHSEKYKAIVPYKIGEEVMYKNNDHIEKGVIEDITLDKERSKIVMGIKFTGNRRVTANLDQIMSSDETDVATIPFTAEDYVEQAKCLNAEELQILKRPDTMSTLQKEWMSLHDQYGHLSSAEMERMLDFGLFHKKFKKLSDRKIICPSCIFGRMRKRPWRHKGVMNRKTIRKKDQNFPGAKVSTDQLVVAQPGLVPRISGRHTKDRICGATGFYDHHSGYSYSALQTSLDGDQTLAAKHSFESHADSCNVSVKSYRADNGRFAEKSFRDAIKEARQTIDFCAVGTHNQNGIIERHFQRLSSSARTLLLHAKRHWPAMVSVVLWPFAYKYAELLYNHLHLDSSGRSPVEKFCKTNFKMELKDIHTFGCPCYVLDRDLQNGGMAPKWEPRSRLGVYLGHSPCHAGSVALVLNPKTLHVSPQFHVAFDDTFSTVPYLATSDVPPNWSILVKESESTSIHDYDLARTWMDSQQDPTKYLQDQEGDYERGRASMYEDEQKKIMNPEGDKIVQSGMDPEGASSDNKNKHLEQLMEPTLPDINQITSRRSTRMVKPTNKVRNSNDKSVQRMFGLATVAKNEDLFEKCENAFLALATHYGNVKQLFDTTINECHNVIYNAAVTNNDVYTLKEMLKLPDIKEFVIAMQKEIEDHQSRDHWELFLRQNIPSGAKTILSVWAFKVKRYPDGRILKHKARLNAHGGMQRWGVDYWETYAPVVNWISVRLLMILSIIHNLDTKSIDFVLAFPQATLERDVFMEMPYGFEYGGKGKYVLKLKKNLYGLSDASYNWFNKLTEGLESEGFVRSEVDQCVFLREDAVVLVYVDDMIALSKDKSVLEDLVKNLKSKNFILTDEGSLDKYLGVDVKRKKDGGLELVQPYLIERILTLLGMKDESVHNTKPTPAVKPLLNKDLSGENRKNNWNYRTAVGMLTYLQGTTRPDISMAVHQCARFSISPKLSHERAIKRIGRYLLGTKDRGIAFKPDDTHGLECYVDADFAGCWDKENPDDPDNVLSRTGYIVFYAGCPLVWASRMQTEIALSTAESEYIALSMAMREVLSLMQLMDEIHKIFEIKRVKPKIHCKVFEDNESCISMAKRRKFSPRTKHIGIKYHHFRSHVGTTVSIHSIDTKQQTADVLTKPVDEALYKHLRMKLCGW